MLSRYKSDVSDAYASLAKAMRHSYDYRAFDRPSDDPLAATQTFDIHWQTDLNRNYASNISNLQGEANTADKILINVESILTQADSTTALKSINGDMNSENRGNMAKQLLSYRDSIVAQMNTKYADNYLFSGSGGTTPFQLVKDPGGDSSKDKLYYRGVDVDTGKMKDGSTPTVSPDQLAGIQCVRPGKPCDRTIDVVLPDGVSYARWHSGIYRRICRKCRAESWLVEMACIPHGHASAVYARYRQRDAARFHPVA